MLQRIYVWLNAGQYVALVVAGATGLLDMQRADELWWLAGGMVLGLGILYYIWPERRYWLYLAAESGLLIGLVAFHPIFAVLGFAFSAHAMMLYPGRSGVAWIGLVTLGTGAGLIHEIGWLNAIFATLGLASGYFSFGLAQYARVRAEDARRESQALLTELQEAHRRLQEYAKRVEALAVAEERNRMAREMHDTVGHRLTVAAVQLEGAQRLIPRDPERAADMIGTVRGQVREALAELRRTVARLRKPLEIDLSLDQALVQLARGVEEATDLRIHLELAGDLPSLSEPQRLALYRAAQEGLTNVQRHAGAQDVWLRLTREGDVMVLQVSDNGVGIHAGAAGDGFGLRGLRERAAQLGGSLALEQRPEGGARLTFRVPLV